MSLRHLLKNHNFAVCYGASRRGIYKMWEDTLFAGDDDPIDVIVGDRHYARRPGEDVRVFKDRIIAAEHAHHAVILPEAPPISGSFRLSGTATTYIEDPELFESLVNAAHDEDAIWEMSKTAEVGGITIVREPDESAAFFKARVMAFLDRMDGMTH